MTTIIEFKHVSKSFGNQEVMRDLNLTIKKGEIFVLVGPSGSGKTTTMKMINALIAPTEGEIFFKDKPLNQYDLQKMRWQMGYVLQQIALFPTMTVKQNIEVIPEMLGWPKAKRTETVDHLLARVKLTPADYRDRLPKQLSGGEQQRIGILRAIAANPEIILMDEPFSALDPISRTALQELVLDIHQELGTTIVFVTHNMKEAIKLGDRIAIMHNGVLLQCDTPEEVIAHPKNQFVKTFFDETEQEVTRTVTIKQVVAAGYLHKEIETEGPIIALEAHLESAYPLLAETDSIRVAEGEKVIGSLFSTDIFAFLSKLASSDITKR